MPPPEIDEELAKCDEKHTKIISKIISNHTCPVMKTILVELERLVQLIEEPLTKHIEELICIEKKGGLLRLKLEEENLKVRFINYRTLKVIYIYKEMLKGAAIDCDKIISAYENIESTYLNGIKT